MSYIIISWFSIPFNWTFFLHNINTLIIKESTQQWSWEVWLKKQKKELKKKDFSPTRTHLNLPKCWATKTVKQKNKCLKHSLVPKCSLNVANNKMKRKRPESIILQDTAQKIKMPITEYWRGYIQMWMSMRIRYTHEKRAGWGNRVPVTRNALQQPYCSQLQGFQNLPFQDKLWNMR